MNMLIQRLNPLGRLITRTKSYDSSESRCVQTAAKKSKPQKKKLRKAPISQRIQADYSVDDDHDEQVDGSLVLLPGGKTPRAPAPAYTPAAQVVRPEDLYSVSLKNHKSSVSSISDGKWTWGEDGRAAHAAEQDVPMWNPKTGFMKTRAQLEAEQAVAVGSKEFPASVADSLSSERDGSISRSYSRRVDVPPSSSVGSSSHSSIPAGLVEPLPPVDASSSAAPTAVQQQQRLPPLVSTNSSFTALPAISRDQVWKSCMITSCGMAAAAAGLHVFAQQQAATMFGTDQAAIDRLLQLPLGLASVQEIGMMLAAAASVTAARFVLLQYWEDFSEATERSNQQVLSPLGWLDVIIIAALTGVTEELLFRGSLIPATLPDYRGVVLSGVVFGLLHVTGGRNLAFAGWATVVGWLYGAAYVSTGNVWVAAGAHSLANLASAALWMHTRRKQLQ